MLGRYKNINNPLTVIAMFATLAEVASTVVLPTLVLDVANIFIWYVIFFPVGIVVAFFLTLNFNPKVLYAPGDYKDEANFLEMLQGTTKVSSGLELMKKNVDAMKNDLSKFQRSKGASKDIKELQKKLDNLSLQASSTGEVAKKMQLEVGSSLGDGFSSLRTYNKAVGIIAKHLHKFPQHKDIISDLAGQLYAKEKLEKDDIVTNYKDKYATSENDVIQIFEMFEESGLVFTSSSSTIYTNPNNITKKLLHQLKGNVPLHGIAY